VRLIASLALAGCVVSLALAVLPPAPIERVLGRVRLARGLTRHGLREGFRELPLLRSWRPVDAETLRLAGFTELTTADLGIAKLGAAAAAALAGLVLSLAPLAIPVLVFVGFVAPSEWVQRRAGARRTARRAALLPYIERVLALAGAGLTVEQALLRAGEADSPLGPLLREVRARAELGVSALDALGTVAERERALELSELAQDLWRARQGGRPLWPLLAERREVLRLARRAERLEAASRVDGALSLVLVLAYLPALLVLVVVPLFLGLLRALEA
jgi:Flp pilus assembly protein TadB